MGLDRGLQEAVESRLSGSGDAGTAALTAGRVRLGPRVASEGPPPALERSQWTVGLHAFFWGGDL